MASCFFSPPFQQISLPIYFSETAKEKIETAFHEILSAFRFRRNGVWLFAKRGGRGVCSHSEINNQWVNILRLRKRSAEK